MFIFVEKKYMAKNKENKLHKVEVADRVVLVKL
jgi:hypothetical protein